MKHWLWIFLSCTGSVSASAQTADSSKTGYHFSGSATITNNGISLVPNFSLNRPAAIFLLSFGGKRFSVDPDIRFSLDAKPWTMLFWGRYQVVTKEKFRLRAGAHLGLNFQINPLPVDGKPQDLNVVRRYLGVEWVPVYSLSPRFRVGAYYLYARLYARGLDPGTVGNTHFVSLNAELNAVSMSKWLSLAISPQIYYLNQDSLSGAYLTLHVQIEMNSFPLSLSSMWNQKLHTQIAGKSPIWNLGLVYTFYKTLSTTPERVHLK